MPDKTQSIWTIIKRLLPFARPYLWKYALAIFTLLITSLLFLLPPLLLKIIIDDAIKGGDAALLNKIAIIMIAAILLSGVFRGVTDYIHEWAGSWFITDIRRYLFNHIQRQSMDFFSTVKTGEILGRLRVDVMSVYGVLVNTFLGSLSEAVQIVGIVGILFYLNWKLALIAIAFIPLLYMVLTYSGKRLRVLSRDARDKDVALLDFFQEKMSNIQVVKLFHRERYEDQKHCEFSQEFIESSLTRIRYKFTSIFLIGSITGIASVIIIWYGGHKVIQGTLSFGSLFAFYLYTVRLYGPIQSLANRGVEIYNGLASADRLLEYLDLVPTIRESDNPIPLERPRGEIYFSDVTFKYPNSDAPVLKDFDLRINPCEKIAIVGASGAGKTTIVSLLCRLYDVDSGAIRMDGVDIRDISFDDLYGSIGVISQDAYLFNSTIEDNIRYGRPDATFDDIIEASQRAHLHDFIMTLPKGYNTVIGSRGMKLSGGQRQRLALARMVLKNSKIWILDEFTSSLDSASELIVYENLEPLLDDKTTIIIAHRLSTIMSADRVIVLQNGRIMEVGTHRSLYQQNGFYRKLFDTQFQKAVN
jgi:ABC-type multidrug transport system fused ATPase/permease subunit